MTRRPITRRRMTGAAVARPGRSVGTSRSGFTLVSVLVAIMLLTVGLLALARTQTAIVASQADEGWRTSALAAARSYMEEVRARDPWTLESEAAVTLDDVGQVAASGPLRRSLVVVEKGANLLEVRVTVGTTRPSVSPVELATYVYRGVK